MNNTILQDHRRTTRRIGFMSGFKSQAVAIITLADSELVYMVRKQQDNVASPHRFSSK